MAMLGVEVPWEEAIRGGDRIRIIYALMGRKLNIVEIARELGMKIEVASELQGHAIYKAIRALRKVGIIEVARKEHRIRTSRPILVYRVNMNFFRDFLRLFLADKEHVEVLIEAIKHTAKFYNKMAKENISTRVKGKHPLMKLGLAIFYLLGPMSMGMLLMALPKFEELYAEAIGGMKISEEVDLSLIEKEALREMLWVLLRAIELLKKRGIRSRDVDGVLSEFGVDERSKLWARVNFNKYVDALHALSKGILNAALLISLEPAISKIAKYIDQMKKKK